MSKTIKKLRIYLNYQDEIRYFYWLEIGEDNSLYFGTGVKGFQRMSHKQYFRTGGATRIELDHRKLNSTEVAGKHSLHASGTLLSKRAEGRLRIERKTKPLHEYIECIPLVGILAMTPLAYPRTNKILRADDIVLPTEPLEGKPFAFLLYVQPPNVPKTDILFRYKERGWAVERCSSLGIFTVHAALYRNPNQILEWAPSHVEAIARGVGYPPPLEFAIFGQW